MRLRMLWRNLTSKQKVEDDLNAELESYRQMLEDDKRTPARCGARDRRERANQGSGARRARRSVA